MGTNSTLAYEIMGTLLISLTPERRASIRMITEQLVALRIPQNSMDAILAAVILEAAETQYAQDGGTVSPKENALDVLKPIFTENKSRKKIGNN